MSQRPRLSEVATFARVSTATVSRALSNPQVVRPETLARIKEAIAHLGYMPDGSARALAKGRARTVGAIVPTLDNAIFARAVQGFQKTLGASGYQLLIAAHEYNQAAEQELVRSLLERSIDALLLIGADHSAQTWETVRASGVQVLIAWSQHERYPYVAFDNREIGRLAARHLISLGHRHLGVISGVRQHNDRARDRVLGFQEVLESESISLPNAFIVEQPFGFEGGRSGLKELLQLRPSITAVFCGNDVLALGCLFEAQSLGLKIPDQLSIIGCDNLPISSQISPGLTTVLLPTYELGSRAAELLLHKLEDDESIRSEYLPVELVVRGTSGAPLSDDHSSTK